MVAETESEPDDSGLINDYWMPKKQCGTGGIK